MRRFTWLVVMLVAASATNSAQSVRTRAELIALMKQSGPAAWNDETAAQLRALIPEEQLHRGFADASHLTVLWAIDAPDASTPRVVSEDGLFSHQLTRVGKTSL